MTYCVVDKPCPHCDGAGFTRYMVVQQESPWPQYMDVACGACMSSGWVEEYRHVDGEDGVPA